MWHKAYGLVLDIYRETAAYPRQEQYGLVSQMRRSALSVVSNIAEGYQRRYTGDYLKFLSVSLGSCAELETQLMLSKDLHFLDNERCDILLSLINEITKMLHSMRKHMKIK